MKLSVKLSLVLAAAAVLPLATVLLFVLPNGAQALRGQLSQLFAQDARALAESSQRLVLDDLEALSLAARTLRLGDLPPDAREPALLLLYKETRRADVIGLFDEKGAPVSEAVRFESLRGDEARDHEAVGELGMSAYSHHVPLDAALETGLAIGPVYSLPDPEGVIVPRTVLAVRLPDRRWVLAMELSLRDAMKRIADYRAGDTGRAMLLDSRNRVIVHPDPMMMRDRTDLTNDPAFTGRSPDHVGAVATAPVLGWKVAVQQSSAEALGSLRRLALQAGLVAAVALAAALLCGLLLVRRVTRPIERLRAAARSVRAGNLDVSVKAAGKDEVAQLARDFDGMVSDLREREELKLMVSLSSTIDLQQMLHRLLDSLGRVASFDRAAVLIARTTAYEVAVARGYLDADEPQLLVPRAGGDSTTDRAARLRGPVRSASGDLLALPIVSREDEVAGLVCLQRRAGYDDEQARSLFAFLQPAAIALDNARLFEEVRRLATIDALTGISNRRHFMQLGLRLYETARRYGQPLAAMMIDVDRFKQINDRYGHAQGDVVLREIADRARTCMRSSDLLGRYGGEEFAVLLPMTQGDSVLSSLAERIRRTIAAQPIRVGGHELRLTVSIGLATLDPSTGSLEALLDHADANLYRAKAEGRDRVVA